MVEHIVELETADKLEVLRKGENWKLPIQNKPHHHKQASKEDGYPSRRASDYFFLLAKEHGSAAKWLPETGYLVTEDPNEVTKDFPYEQWRDQALKEAGYTQAGINASD